MFVTLVILRYEPSTGKIEFVNGGHPPPIILDTDGIPELIGESTGPLVGAIEEAEWTTLTHQLQPGERLVLYTDGVTEARDGNETMLGEHGLLEMLKQTGMPQDDPATLCQRLVKQIQDREPGEASDDITVLVLGRPVS